MSMNSYGPISAGVTGSEGGGGRLKRVGVGIVMVVVAMANFLVYERELVAGVYM
jgi:hypothetical protein